MTTKKPTASQRIQALAVMKPTVIPAKSKEVLVQETNVVKKKHAGGRPPGGQALARRSLRAILANHYAEEVEIELIDQKTSKLVKIKKPRVLAMMDKLYEIGIAGNDTAIDRWLNRALGKAPQPLIGDEEEDPIKIDLGVGRILSKAYGTDTDDE